MAKYKEQRDSIDRWGLPQNELAETKKRLEVAEELFSKFIEVIDGSFSGNNPESIIPTFRKLVLLAPSIRAFLAPTNPADDPTSPDHVLVRRDDLQKLGDASGWDCDTKTYNRLQAALKEKP